MSQREPASTWELKGGKFALGWNNPRRLHGGNKIGLGPKHLGWEGNGKEIHSFHAGTKARAKFWW